jgi:RNA polymerase sigma-70 factor (ECF subfamily)
VTTAEVATASAPHESTQPQGRSGDGAAAARTERLFADYGRIVGGLCLGLLRDRAEAEDATQQTFLSAHRALVNGSDPRAPAAWLMTIARNECWARIRSRMREPLPKEEIDVTSTNDPLAEAIRLADVRMLWDAIEALPRQQRDALLLREFGGLTYAELAGALGVSGPAVESLLFRARQSLRAKLRAGRTSISGASWIDALLRIAAGGAPVAAKVAVLGVGAAAVGGTAVVVPSAFDNHRPSQAPAPAKAVAPPPKLHTALVSRVVTPPVQPAPAVRVVRPARKTASAGTHEGEHAAIRADGGREGRRSGGGGDGGGDGGSGSDGGSDGGGD